MLREVSQAFQARGIIQRAAGHCRRDLALLVRLVAAHEALHAISEPEERVCAPIGGHWVGRFVQNTATVWGFWGFAACGTQQQVACHGAAAVATQQGSRRSCQERNDAHGSSANDADRVGGAEEVPGAQGCPKGHERVERVVNKLPWCCWVASCSCLAVLARIAMRRLQIRSARSCVPRRKHTSSHCPTVRPETGYKFTLNGGCRLQCGGTRGEPLHQARPTPPKRITRCCTGRILHGALDLAEDERSPRVPPKSPSPVRHHAHEALQGSDRVPKAYVLTDNECTAMGREVDG